MSLELFQKIVEQAAPITEQVCLHLMGDPLVHPKLNLFIETCARHKVPVFLVTNGYLLKPAHFEALLNQTLRQVCFSLHSFFDNFPERDPTSYLETIFEFTEQAFKRRPDLYINYRLWNLDSPSNKNLLEQNATLLRHIETRFAKQGDFQRLPDPKRIKSKRILNRLYLHADSQFIWPSPTLPVRSHRGTCKGLQNHFGILSDGTVVPCCLDKEANIPLGNVADKPLSAILDSDRAQAILNGFRSGNLVEDLCKRCPYIERFDKQVSSKSHTAV